MLENYEELFLRLVEEYYGLIPSIIVKKIIRYGQLTVGEAKSHCCLKSSDFQKGLRVLLRVRLISITANRSESKRLISIENDHLICCLFFANYLMAINRLCGVEAVSLMKTLFLYGWISSEDLIIRTLFHIIKNNNLDSLCEDQIRLFISSLIEKFNDLVTRKIIIQKHQDEKNKTVNSVAIDENLILVSLQKLLNSDKSIDCDRIFNTNSSFSYDLEALNFLYFIDIFQYLLNMPVENDEALFLFKTVLSITFERSHRMKSDSVSMEQMHEKFSKKYPNVTIGQLQRIVSVYAHYFAPNFLHISRDGVAINFLGFLTNLVKVIVKAFVAKNFGETSVRIYGSLLEQVCVFENDLISSLKIDMKELHQNLYVLDQNKLIQTTFFSEVNKSAIISPRNIRKTFAADLQDAVNLILKRSYYSIYCLNHRRSIEINAQKGLITRKNQIENYKKEIEEKVSDIEKRNNLLTIAHSYMAAADHQQSEKLITYDNKIDKVLFHLVNHIFVLTIWRQQFSKYTENEI
ncbi:hypothetical protein SSS_03604 [Sarcoptes scabiei]|uniref:DNA-directed RNA polymerase III subunit RPC3 n=1 Tax=Sarcoptes scabiei TaxID=52283 RepID=A0A834RCJ6_SARSC|nr:hypothetical protein SSS_03604 [Sarcoptes scabiei]